MNNTWQLVGGIVGVGAYLSLILSLFKSDAKQSFAAFLLWGMLDSIALVTTYLEHGNFWLPLSNAVGSSVITVILIFKRQVTWTAFESMTAALVLICLAVWYNAGETAGIVASSLAVVIASIPQMRETFRSPSSTPKTAYAIFLVANLISFCAGSDWTIKERFYAGCAVFLTVVILGGSFRSNPGKHFQAS